MSRLADAAAAMLGGVLARTLPLHGGDLSDVVRIVLADGREAVVKGGPAPQVEAAMLAAMARAGAPTPAVLAASADALVIEVMPSGGLDGAWANLGAVLARLHAARGPSYGWPENYAFGRVAIDNRFADDWPTFWAERRLLAHKEHVPADLARHIETLAGRLPDRLPLHPPPALLHGDLWSGNVLADGSRVTALIDPACYHGHAEVDLAMLSLFDRPPPAFADAYGALDPGHADRRPIYQLWPALVHLRLFGGGYRPMVERLLSLAGS